MQPDTINNYAYYETLGFGNYTSWSEKDLAQFLLFDSLDTSLETRDVNEKSFLAEQEHRIKKYRQYILPLAILDIIFLLVYLRGSTSKSSQKKVLFEGAKYPSLIWEAKKHYQVRLTVSSKEDRLFAMKSFTGYLNINDLDPLFFYYVKEKNIRYLYELVEKMENKLKMVAPDYIVLCMDMLPLERAIVLAAKKLGIPTLVVQHGMCDVPTCSHDFKVADYVLMWGEYFKDLCIKYCMRKAEDIYILGYPYVMRNNMGIDNQRRTVCYLGQDLEAGNKDFLLIKLETIHRLSKICDALGLDFIYRPHPRREEQKVISRNLAGILVTPKGETLQQTFRRADIFVSFSSTALIEAAMSSKVAVQLLNYPIATDNLEGLGVCSQSFQTIEELQSYLTKIADAPDLNRFQIKCNNDYVETKYDPGKRFMEIIEIIEKSRYAI